MTDLESSFSECLTWWMLTFSIGIAFREFARDAVGRWIGRVSVAASCFVLISFCQFAIHQCGIQRHIAVTSGKKITLKEDSLDVHTIAHVAAVKSFEVTTPNGHTVAWNTSSGRRERLPVTDGRLRRSSPSGGYGDRIATESGGIVGGMPGAEQF